MKFKSIVFIFLTLITIIYAILIYQISLLTHTKTKPYIVCTTTIIHDTVQNICKDTVELVALMGPGIDPHLYKPVESDIFKIASADIIFYNGLHLEAKMGEIFEILAKHQTTIAVTKDIPTNLLLPVAGYQTIYDPHVWFDISLWMHAVEAIYQALIVKIPEHTDLYRQNKINYLQKLETALQQSQQMMSIIPIEKRVLITAHDAFSYFGRLYACKVVALQGISTESTPGAYDLQEIIRLIYTQKIPAIFIESSIPIKNILAIQEGVAAYDYHVNLGEQLYSDALGCKGSTGETYIDMIMHNMQTIVSALQ